MVPLLVNENSGPFNLLNSESNFKFDDDLPLVAEN